MAKTTTVTTSYTSNIIVNGTTVPADKIYANGIQVRRCIVNGKDVIHKFTRTVVTVSSNLTLTVTVRFTVDTVDFVNIGILYFKSPIYADVTVTDNGSSGFTSITLVNPLLIFYGTYEDPTGDDTYSSQQQLTNQSLPIGQTTTLTFSDFNGKSLPAPDVVTPAMGYTLSFNIQDPDGKGSGPYILKNKYTDEYYPHTYKYGHTIQRKVDNEIISDNTVQEY